MENNLELIKTQLLNREIELKNQIAFYNRAHDILSSANAIAKLQEVQSILKLFV